MDFSLKKQMNRKAPVVKNLASFAALCMMVLVLSGCGGQKANTRHTQASLLSEPVVDEKLIAQDFAFPSQPPSLMRGREIFQQQCVKCHAQSYWQSPKVKEDLAYTTPIDIYLMLTTGKAPKVTLPTPQRRQLLPGAHSGFRDSVNRDDRWAVIFYSRYLAGAGDITSPDPKVPVDAIFGGNCAVCHGQKGQADGPLYTAKTGNHELHDGAIVKNFMPAPANFKQYNRVYNRTDAQLLKYICEGIYPSAMPSWYGDVNLDKDTGKVTYVFDEKLISNLVRHIRTFSYVNDLTPDLPEVKAIPPGLTAIHPCQPVPNSQPWTNSMRNDGPYKGHIPSFPAANPITGGMVGVEADTAAYPAPITAPTYTVGKPSQEGAKTE